MSTLMRVLGLAVAAGGLWATGLLSVLPYHPSEAGAAIVRVSFRAPATGEEVCRARTASELAELPQHMRTPEVCEARPLTYRVAVTLDGEVRFEGTYRGRGARGDRPVSVLEELAVEPGTYDFMAEISTVADGEETLESRTLDRPTLELLAGRVYLVSLDGSPGRIELRQSDT